MKHGQSPTVRAQRSRAVKIAAGTLETVEALARRFGVPSSVLVTIAVNAAIPKWEKRGVRL
jgi:hypothetical protein